jgi:alcohol dehydrogenase (cytochrome c)
MLRRLVIGLLLLIALAVAAVAGVPQLRWRAALLGMQVGGDLPDLTLGELLAMLQPGSGQWLEPMVATRNPYQTVKNPRTGASDIEAGANLFRGGCAGCHGADAGGTDTGPSLVGREFKAGNTAWGLYRSIRYGVPGTSMPPHDMPADDIWRLAGFISSLNPTAEEGAAVSTAPSLTAAIDVPYAELRAAGQPGPDWLTYSGDYAATRHSRLTDISTGNVARLAPRWVRQLQGDFGRLETTPIVRDGVMYVTVPPLQVLALDAGSGAVLWSWQERVPDDIRPACCDGGPVNRGVAILGDRVFIGTPDARVVALSARTGKKLWDTAFVDYRLGYSVTGAPIAYGDLVVVGIGSGDFATRCFLVAFDAATGQERWRWYTIPGPGEPGHETWQGDSWKTGGTATWMSGSYDPELDLLYWGIGNAAPNFNASLRNGDNLYSNSVVALEGSSGKLRWHFQFTPADAHDWDATQIPILVDAPAGAAASRLMLFPNRNGYYYRLDRERGSFLGATEFVKQNWNDGFEPNGRPKPRASATPTRAGVPVWPGPGATNWWSSSYDPATGLVFVPTHDKGQIFLTYDQDDPELGEPNLEGGVKEIPGGEDLWMVRALRAMTGEIAWDFRYTETPVEAGTGGLMSTAGGVLFGGNQENFYAWESATGRALWRFPVGKAINAAPVSYRVNGEQQVAIAAGRLIMAFGLSPGSPGPAPAQSQ